MPRIKKAPLTDKVELQPVDSQEVITPISDSPVPAKKEKKGTKTVSKPLADVAILPEIQEPPTDIREPKFKEIHTKDSFWLENDIYQTIEDLTQGTKRKKALIINKALKDYFKRNKIELKPLRPKNK